MRFSTEFPKLKGGADGWKALDPPKWLTSVASMIAIGGGFGFGALYLYSIAAGAGAWDIFATCPPGKLLLAAIVGLPLHEVCHGLVHPRFGMSSNTHFGFHPKMGVAFCIYDDAHTKARALVMLALPLVLLTIVPLVFAFSGLRLEFWAIVAVLNATGVGGDLIFAALLTAVPRGAVVGVDEGRMMYCPCVE